MIHIRRNVVHPQQNAPEVTTPKTKAGRRDIPIDDNLMKLLIPLRDQGYIIGGDQPITLSAHRNMWKRINKQINLYGATAHILRHSYLTYAVEIAYRYTYDYGGYDTGILNVLTTPTVWDTSANSSRSYSFSALKDGKWSAWSTLREITVMQRPALQTPEVSVQGTIAQGENLTITVGSVENISYYYVNLYNNSKKSIISRYLGEPGTTTISGYYLPLGSVRVEVCAYGNNNGSSQVSKNLTVIAATCPDAPDIIPPVSMTIQARTYYSFTIQTDEAEKAAVRYFRIGSPNDLYYSEFNTDTGATTSWQTYQYNSGNKYAYSFAVLKNGVWSEWSPFTIITIE